MYKLAACNNRPRFDAIMQSFVFRTFTKQNNKIYNIIIIVNEAAVIFLQYLLKMVVLLFSQKCTSEVNKAH